MRLPSQVNDMTLPSWTYKLLRVFLIMKHMHPHDHHLVSQGPCHLSGLNTWEENSYVAARPREREDSASVNIQTADGPVAAHETHASNDHHLVSQGPCHPSIGEEASTWQKQGA